MRERGMIGILLCGCLLGEVSCLWTHRKLKVAKLGFRCRLWFPHTTFALCHISCTTDFLHVSVLETGTRQLHFSNWTWVILIAQRSVPEPAGCFMYIPSGKCLGPCQPWGHCLQSLENELLFLESREGSQRVGRRGSLLFIKGHLYSTYIVQNPLLLQRTYVRLVEASLG